jgi:hypothetical protein
MAAAATPIPENLHVAIINASAATSAIRALIETTQGNVENISLDAFIVINNTMLLTILRLSYALNGPDETIRKDRLWAPGVLPPAISRDISSIPMSYRRVELLLQKLTDDVYAEEEDAADNFDMNIVNEAYTESIEVLRTMEAQWQSLLAVINPMMAGPAMNNNGGYRKRKQRTQRKQRKQHKQKHCKTQSKRK